MSAQEYGLWRAHYGMEPWGDERMDMGFGVVASTLANAHRKAGATPFTPLDFMPYARASQAQEEPAEESPLQYLKSLESKRGHH